jgi:hypothetical protein
MAQLIVATTHKLGRIIYHLGTQRIPFTNPQKIVEMPRSPPHLARVQLPWHTLRSAQCVAFPRDRSLAASPERHHAVPAASPSAPAIPPPGPADRATACPVPSKVVYQCVLLVHPARAPAIHQSLQLVHLLNSPAVFFGVFGMYLRSAPQVHRHEHPVYSPTALRPAAGQLASGYPGPWSGESPSAAQSPTGEALGAGERMLWKQPVVSVSRVLSACSLRAVAAG